MCNLRMNLSSSSYALCQSNVVLVPLPVFAVCRTRALAIAARGGACVQAPGAVAARGSGWGPPRRDRRGKASPTARSARRSPRARRYSARAGNTHTSRPQSNECYKYKHQSRRNFNFKIIVYYSIIK